jgi:hypothetical protein
MLWHDATALHCGAYTLHVPVPRAMVHEPLLRILLFI